MPGNRLPFVADAMHGDYSLPLNKEPEHSRVQFTNVTQLKQAITKGLGERFAVILAIAQFCQTGKN
jgi:hypothetical protein